MSVFFLLKTGIYISSQARVLVTLRPFCLSYKTMKYYQHNLQITQIKHNHVSKFPFLLLSTECVLYARAFGQVLLFAKCLLYQMPVPI